MPEDHNDSTLSRRDCVRAAAIAVLAAGLGIPTAASGATAVGRIQVKFYRNTADGGALVGTVELSDAVSAFLGSTAGARGYMKWYDGTQQVAIAAAPQMCCIKLTP
jgi:hypothetical protein